MGAKGKRERPSERKRAAARANAKRPRGAWAGTPEREQLDSAKAEIRGALTLEGAARLAALIRDPDTPAELFLAAFKLAGDRVGLPPRNDVELSSDTVPPIEVVFLRSAPGWLGVGSREATAEDLERARSQAPPGQLRPVARELVAGTPVAAPAPPALALVEPAASVPTGEPPEPAAEPLAAVPAPFADVDRALGGRVAGVFGSEVEDD